MKLKNKYFILRHGHTVYQIEKEEFVYPSLSKNMAIELSEKGKKQIKILAKRLKEIKINLIFSSDFLRTKQTAEITAKETGVNKINFDKRLRDINLGVYHGKPKKDYYHDFPIKDSKKRFSMKPKKGESWNDVRKRILNFLRETEKKHRGKKILIVSHGDPLWLLEGMAKNWPRKKKILFRKNNLIKKGELRKF